MTESASYHAEGDTGALGHEQDGYSDDNQNQTDKRADSAWK
jgi:hypothetical protein